MSNIKKEVSLRVGREPLQVPYPKGYKGLKSGKPEDKEIHISANPRYLFEAEIEIVEAYVSKLPYSQSLIFSGALLIDPKDPLLTADHNELDEIERHTALRPTRYVEGGCERSIRDRVLIIREQGYFGVGQRALSPA